MKNSKNTLIKTNVKKQLAELENKFTLWQYRLIQAFLIWLTRKPDLGQNLLLSPSEDYEIITAVAFLVGNFFGDKRDRILAEVLTMIVLLLITGFDRYRQDRGIESILLEIALLIARKLWIALKEL